MEFKKYSPYLFLLLVAVVYTLGYLYFYTSSENLITGNAIESLPKEKMNIRLFSLVAFSFILGLIIERD